MVLTSPTPWTHETFRDVVELLIPELQKRGVFKQEYREGTLREKLFGAGPRLVARIREPATGAACASTPGRGRR
nr:coenzyme F420-dependent N5,N10-methylene tetrahydromethanopterin reductase [Raoultella sp. NCTC 9187]